MAARIFSSFLLAKFSGSGAACALPWCARAVLSVVMARLCSLKAAAERDGPDDDVEGVIANMGGDERFRFSLKWLSAQTGLTRHSVITAKRLLNHRFGIVQDLPHALYVGISVTRLDANGSMGGHLIRSP